MFYKRHITVLVNQFNDYQHIKDELMSNDDTDIKITVARLNTLRQV